MVNEPEVTDVLVCFESEPIDHLISHIWFTFIEKFIDSPSLVETSFSEGCGVITTFSRTTDHVHVALFFPFVFSIFTVIL